MQYSIYSEDLNNYGDLSLVVQSVSVVRREDPQSELRVLSWNAVPDFAIKELERYNARVIANRWSYIFNSLCAEGVALWPGGQLFRNNSSSKYLILMALLTLFFRIKGVTQIVMGAGASDIGRLKSLIYRVIFRGADCFYVRDNETRGILDSRKFSNDIVVSADVMFSQLGSVNQILRLPSDSFSSGKSFLTVSPCYSKEEGRVFDVDELVESIIAFCDSNPGSVVRIVAHDVRPSMDYVIMQRISESLAVKGIDSELLLPDSLEDLMSIYRESDHVITNRLHAIIFSCLSGCKFSIIEDGNVKISSLIKQLGLNYSGMKRGLHFTVSRDVLTRIDCIASKNFSWLIPELAQRSSVKGGA